MRSNENLRAEYVLIQGMYEAFDQRALSLKALATPLLGAAIAVGFKEDSPSILAAALLVSLSLWLLEAIWKLFQYCLVERIELLESWFRGEGDDDLAPFQIYAFWGAAWDLHSSNLSSLVLIMRKPFVFLPYLPCHSDRRRGGGAVRVSAGLARARSRPLG